MKNEQNPKFQNPKFQMSNEPSAISHQPSAIRHVVIVGAGPAGLTAAWELVTRGIKVTVLEKYHLVGGIARTERYKDYYYDIGGHRFFTKVDEVNALWQTWMGDEMLLRPRISRIYYDGKFFDYPLRAFNALFNMGIWRSFVIMLSYLQYQLFPYKQEETFEQRVTNRFGKKLFEIFFKTYTEKVWGIRRVRYAPSGRRSASKVCRSFKRSAMRSSSRAAKKLKRSSKSFIIHDVGPA